MLDPVRILIVTVLSSIMSVAILGSLLPTGIPGVRRWMSANAICIVALILFALQPIGLSILSILLANELMALASVLALEGCRQFFGLRPSQPAAYAGCLAVLLGIGYWTYGSPDIDARIGVVSAFHGAIYACIAWTAWRGRPPRRPPYVYRFVSIAASLGAFGHWVRGTLYVMGFGHQATLLQSTPLNIAFLSLGILALPTLSIGMVMLAHDRMAERLERWANFDELTGALTRRAFITRAEAAIEDARRSGQRLSLAIVDIDHFKTINDRYGHAAGDRVLEQFGEMIASSVHAAGLFGRLGGEEFAVLFPGLGRDDACTRVDSWRAKSLAMRVREQVDGTAHATGSGVTFSAGVDEYRYGESLAGLMLRADKALYEAKTLGRDRVVMAAW